MRQLRQKMARPLDRSCDHRRKIRDEQREIPESWGRADAATIYIDSVAERVEGVETDPDGQDDRQVELARVHAQFTQQNSAAVDEEIEIFEASQKSQIHQNRTKNKRPA